jgi:IMP dehydrogenase
MGVPQLSAIMDVVEVAKQNGVKTIADGGIRFSGDIVKALAAGADTVMLGSIFAGTDEAPGKVVEIDHKKYKIYRGMGSVSAMKEGSAARYGQEYRKGQERKLIAEGVEGKVAYRGSVEDVVNQMVGGLRTGMYYLGSKTLNELYENSEFIKITQASLIESFPHDLT